MNDVTMPESNPPQIDVTISYMVMKKPPKHLAELPERWLGRYQILPVTNPSRDFYLFLYHQVGSPIGWYERKLMNPDLLQAIITHPDNPLFVLYGDGAPLGYYEYDLRDPKIGSLAYFGLFPQACGLGLGHWFLDQAITHLWQANPSIQQIIVNSCTLDHPAALNLYRKHGFLITAQKNIRINDPSPIAAKLILP